MNVEQFLDCPMPLMSERLRAVVGLTPSKGSFEDLLAGIFDEQPRQPENKPGGIAVLPMYGLISHRMGFFGTSTQGFARAFRERVADPAVSALVIDIDSPGGFVDGVPELWREIFQARGEKPIIAVANTLAASAAYWLATAADEIVVTPSGDVGSIGVWAAHMEISRRLEAEGVTVTIWRAGKYKAEFTAFEPLTEEAEDYLQQRIDETYSWFLRDVGKGRGKSVSEVRKDWGQGRLVSAKEAVELGMADRVGTLDETLARLGGKRRGAMRAEETQMNDNSGTSVEVESATDAPPAETVVPPNRSEQLAPENTPWKKPRLEDYTDEDWEDLSDAEKRKIASDFAWTPKMPPDKFTDLKLPHHRPSDGWVVPNGVRNAKARAGQVQGIPSSERPAVDRHLDDHMKKIEERRKRNGRLLEFMRMKVREWELWG